MAKIKRTSTRGFIEIFERDIVSLKALFALISGCRLKRKENKPAVTNFSTENRLIPYYFYE
jgi:hypothetical protein